MEAILDLPDIVLEKIAMKLEVFDLNHFRLSCKRFYSLALPKGNLEKIAINLRRLNEYDLESVFVFLETIGFGKFVTLKSIGVEGYGSLMEQTTQGKLLNFAKNLSSFEGDIVLMDYLSNCKSIESLNLFCEPHVYDVVSFHNYFSQLKTFINLKELQINNLLERLPVNSINIITQNAVQLIKLGFSFIRFQCGDDTVIEYIIIDEIREPVFMINQCSVVHWVFNQVGTKKFKIILPSTILSINMISSPSILWNGKCTNLKKLVYVNNYCSILTICPKIDHLFKHNVDNFCLYLRNKLMFEKLKLNSNIKHVTDYKSFTLATNYITSSVVDTMISTVGMNTLSKIHLINHRCGKEYPNVAMDQCTDLDIMRILMFYKNINVLILESFDEITIELVELISLQSLNLRLFRLIKCCAFNHEDTTSRLQKIQVTFKVDIVNKCSNFIKSLHVLMYPQYY